VLATSPLMGSDSDWHSKSRTACSRTRFHVFPIGSCANGVPSWANSKLPTVSFGVFSPLDADNCAVRGHLRGTCYHCRMFNFGKPKTAADWIVHIAGAIVAIFLVWWMLRMYVL